MSVKLFFKLVTILPLIIVVGCAADMEAQKRRGEDRRNLGEAYMESGDYTAALRELLEAEKIYADDPLLHNYLGLVYYAKGKFDRAEASFKRALALKPDFTDARNNLGVNYIKQKKWDQAIACFSAITENLLYATPQFPLTNLGWVYENKKMYDMAAGYYQKALKLAPYYATALRGLGRCYVLLGKSDAAVVLLEKAVAVAASKKSRPEAAEAYFDLARAYEAVGEINKAINAYRAVGTLAPGSSSAQKSLKILGRLEAKP